MKKAGLLLLCIVLFSVSTLASPDLEVEKVNLRNVAVTEIGNPVYYDLLIKNLGGEDQFRIFTLVGVQIEPSEYVTLPPGETKIKIEANLGNKILKERKGLLSFEYQIKGLERELYKDKLLVNIVSLKDILNINYRDFHPADNLIEVHINNSANVELNNLTLILDSVFFRESIPLELAPYENKSFSVSVNLDGNEKLVAGPYIVSATIVTGRENVNLDGIINFLEREGTSVDESTQGLIIRTKIVTKTNKGNTPVTAEVSLTKDAISRLFTTHSIEPVSTSREGFFVEYVWRKSLNPGESLIVTSRTNYTVPFFVALFIVAVGVLVKFYYLKAVYIRKRVSLVRTKGGEFALRVVLKVKARKSVEGLQLIDSLPGMTKLYENFGKQPDKIEKDARRLVWNVGHLRRGEERVYSYVMYSKLKVVGRLELPQAFAIFKKEGKVGEVYSNRTYFAIEGS